MLSLGSHLSFTSSQDSISDGFNGMRDVRQELVIQKLVVQKRMKACSLNLLMSNILLYEILRRH